MRAATRGSRSESVPVKSIFRQGVCSVGLRAVAVVALCLAGALWAGPAAQAADYYWDTVNPGTPGTGDGTITGGAGTWGTGNSNWTTDGGANNVKWPNNTIDTAVFTDVGGTVKMNSVNAGGITFNNPSTTGYTITGSAGSPGTNTLSLGDGGVIQTLATDGNSSGTQINKFLDKMILSGATATFSSNSANSTMEIGYNVSGSIVGSSTVNTVLTLNGSNTGKNVLGYATNQGSQTIINNGTGKTLAIVKDGPGTWWISGKNLSTGGLTVKAGTLVHSDKDNALGGGSVTLGDSAGGANDATVLSGYSGYTISRPITLAANTTGILTLGGGTGIAATTYSGGVLGSNNLTLASNGTLLTMSGATLNNTGKLTVKGGGNTDITSVIGSNVTSLTKNDAGTLTLSGLNNTYTGATTVNAGTLLVNGSLAAAAGKVTVNANGTLGGTGTIARDVDVFGTLAPGASIESIDTGNLSIGATGTLDNELGRNSGTPVSDLVNVTGAVTLTAGANLKLTLFAGLDQPVFGDIFYLVANDGDDAVTGVFTKLGGEDTALGEGSVFTWNSQSWQITYKADYQAGGGSSFAGGNDIAIKVPEPATLGLLAIGGLALLRRRLVTA